MPQRLTDHELKRLYEEGKTQSEIARRYGLNKSTVSRRLRKFKIDCTASAAHAAGEVITEEIDGFKALNRLHSRTETLLDQLEQVWSGEANLAELEDKLGRTSLLDALLNTRKELRNQLRLMAEISARLYDVQSVRKFQDTVIDEIRQVDPSFAKKIVDRLVNVSRVYRHLDPGEGPQPIHRKLIGPEDEDE